MNGVLNIFKPKGMSSFDAVRIVKKVAGTGKVGHTGTLDPEATGVKCRVVAVQPKAESEI